MLKSNGWAYQFDLSHVEAAGDDNAVNEHIRQIYLSAIHVLTKQRSKKILQGPFLFWNCLMRILGDQNHPVNGYVLIITPFFHQVTGRDSNPLVETMWSHKGFIRTTSANPLLEGAVPLVCFKKVLHDDTLKSIFGLGRRSVLVKKLLSILFVLVLFFPSTAMAANKPTGNRMQIFLDGNELKFQNAPLVYEGNTMVPFRSLFEALGVSVNYDSHSKTIRAQKENTTVNLTMGQNVAFVNSAPVKLSISPLVIKGNTYVPLRFVSQSFNYSVTFQGEQIFLASPLMTSTPSPILTPLQTSSPIAAQDLTAEQIGELSNRVVYIETLDSAGKVYATGSGVIVGSDGEVITNFHVIEGASSARIYFSSTDSVVASYVTIYDKERDLALLIVEKTGLPTVSIGDSSKLKLGEAVVAIGSPLGFTNSLSSGVVSTPLRMVDGSRFIQMTAPIDHGSSGGALFNMRGELVGITTALIESSADLNLAIPSEDVATFLRKPRSSQLLTSIGTPVGSVVPADSDINIITPQQLEAYMDKNYSIMDYKGLTLHFDWFVTLSADGKNYSIGGIMKDSREWSDWAKYQINDHLAMPSMIYFILDELAKDLNLKNTFMALFLNTYFSFYPSSFPPNSIIVEGRGYRLNYSFVYGSIEEEQGRFYYNNQPENSNTLESIPIY